jgi:hypothetical protein
VTCGVVRLQLEIGEEALFPACDEGDVERSASIGSVLVEFLIDDPVPTIASVRRGARS